VFLKAYSSDFGNLPFSIVLVNEDNQEVSTVKAKGERMPDIGTITGDKLKESMRTIIAFEQGNGQLVRAKLVATHKKSTLSVAQWLLPVEQELSDNAQLSDISDWTQEEIPTEIGLQAYPNPFNPTTTVQLALPSASAVTVQVYDVTGRLVSELFSGEKQAGVHEFGFNASKLSSGTYFVRLQYQSANGSPQFVSKAITLIK
jgi:hypothetical protein